MVFALMLLTGVLAGGAVLLTAILTAKLGLCDPFVLPFGKWHWAINPWPMFQRKASETIGAGTSKIVFEKQLPTSSLVTAEPKLAGLSPRTFPGPLQPQASGMVQSWNTFHAVPGPLLPQASGMAIHA